MAFEKIDTILERVVRRDKLRVRQRQLLLRLYDSVNLITDVELSELTTINDELFPRTRNAR